ncbi:hypothetical protein, partial [Streptococcus pneumoniae]|uniref:hypothetical protein n=1 Tax=Streptococcus pneumoniae TaxID=1313 RepID=UPI001E4E4717
LGYLAPAAPSFGNAAVFPASPPLAAPTALPSMPVDTTSAPLRRTPTPKPPRVAMIAMPDPSRVQVKDLNAWLGSFPNAAFRVTCESGGED